MDVEKIIESWKEPNSNDCRYVPVGNKPRFEWIKKSLIEPSEQHKKVAVFTVTRDEKILLPIWLNHYKSHFSPQDIFIIDNETADGSTTDLDANVVLAKSDGPWKIDWLRETVKSFQSHLLANGYSAVLFTEVDELVFPDPNKFETFSSFLGGFLKSDLTHFRCNGFEIIHDFNNEPRIDWSKTILEQRRLWSPTTLYSKPLLSKIPLKWRNGFHDLEGIPNIPVDENFYLVHLHLADFETCDERNRSRGNYRFVGDDIKKEMTKRLTTSDGIKVGAVERIPDFIKKAI